MRNGVRAIDFMYYVSTPEFIHRWNTAKTGELICRMERAIGGLPKYESIDAMIAKMDEAEVERVFITQCKMWSYRNKWMYMDTSLDEVVQYTTRYPDRFVGLAGYNPFRIKESLEEIPFRRVARPEEIAEAVVFLSTPGADFITGQTLSVSGGLTMA